MRYINLYILLIPISLLNIKVHKSTFVRVAIILITIQITLPINDRFTHKIVHTVKGCHLRRYFTPVFKRYFAL